MDSWNIQKNMGEIVSNTFVRRRAAPTPTALCTEWIIEVSLTVIGLILAP